MDLFVLAYLLVIPLVHLLMGKPAVGQSLINTTALGLCYIAIRILSIGIRSLVLLNAFAEILAITQCFLLLIAIGQYAGWMPIYHPLQIVTGMFFNPGPFAIYLAGLTIFNYTLMLYWLQHKKLSKALLPGILTIVSLFFVATSLSRSAWLGLFFPMLVIGFFLLRHTFMPLTKPFRKWLLPAGLITCFLSFLGLWKTYQFKPASADGRGLIWQSTALMIKDHFWTGTGIGKFAASYPVYQGAFFAHEGDKAKSYINLAGDTRYAFNDLLQSWAENGIVGFFLSMLIVAGLIYKWIRLLRTVMKNRADGYQAALLATGAIPVVVLLAGLTSYPLQMVPIALLFWTALAVWVSCAQVNGNYWAGRSWIIRCTGIVLTCAGLFLSYHTVKMHIAYKQFAHLCDSKDVHNNASDTGTQLQALYPHLHNNVEYLSMFGIYYKERNEEEKAIPYLERSLDFTPATSNYYELAECYEQTRQWDLAARTYAIINKSIPNLLKPYYKLAMLKYNTGDMAGFAKLAEYAIAFKPKINNAETESMKQDLQVYLENVRKYVLPEKRMFK